MKPFYFLGAAMALASAAGGFAQPTPPARPSVHDLQPAHVPLIAEPLDVAQPSTSIWFKGDRPANSTIARLALRPVDAVAVEAGLAPAGAKPVVLWRALAGEPSRFTIVSELRAPDAERLYCADGKGSNFDGKLFCLWDSDRNGAFEALSLGTGEGGDSLPQLSIIGPKQPLPKPLAYRPAQGEEVGRIEAVYANCGKDHDRPRYSFGQVRSKDELQRLSVPGAGAAQMAQLQMLLRGFAAPPCKEAEPLRTGERGYPAAGIGRDSLAVLLGELAIEVGSKDAGAPVKLLGMRDPDRLYRLVGGGIEPLSEARPESQIALEVQQKFDKPVVMVAGAGEVREGVRGVGEVVLTVPIAHGYMGVLTADTKIRTLFSSRSLPAGTVLYGVPMSQRTVMTINGVPQGPFGSPGPATAEQTRLVWCVPVEDEGQWTATCLPDQGGRYTLLKGQRPAFEVTRFSYDATTSTNDGPPPVEARPGDFGKPLAYRFTLKSLGPSEIVLTQDTIFGEQAVNSRELRIDRTEGAKSALLIGRGAISFAAVDGAADKVEIARVRDISAGADVRVESGIMRRDAAAAGAK